MSNKSYKLLHIPTGRVWPAIGEGFIFRNTASGYIDEIPQYIYLIDSNVFSFHEVRRDCPRILAGKEEFEVIELDN